MKDVWKDGLSFLAVEALYIISQVDVLCDLLLQVHSSSSRNSIVCEHTCNFFSKLWESQTDLFVRQPALSGLHSVVQILAFGMALAKVDPEMYVEKLNILPGKLKKVAKKLQNSGLIPKAHFFSIREVVDLSPTKILCMIGDLLCQKPGPVLVILDQLVYMFPGFIVDESALSKIIEILMRAIRISSLDHSDPSNTTKSSKTSEEPSVLALDIFVRLVGTLSTYGAKFTDLPRILLQLFDVLRAFPTTLAHSEARLNAWWHFICCLPADLLSEGFRKFLSPFLANLLGRYLSISAPQGDPQLHPYRLSQGSVYEGNIKALELIQHVYSCFFSGSSITFRYLNVPRLSVTNQLLVQNSYPILVCLLYWIRAVLKYRCISTPRKQRIPPHCLPSQSVDEIWCGCINYLLKVSKSVQELPAYKKVTPFQSPSISPRDSNSNSTLLTVWQHVMTTTCELIQPRDVSFTDPETIATCPYPLESLNIIHNFTKLLEEFKVSDKEKVDLVFSLCEKSAQLGHLWLNDSRSTRKLHATKDDFHRWATQTIGLINLDPRFNVLNKSASLSRLTAENSCLTLTRALLNAILPEFMNFMTTETPSQSSLYDDSTQLSALKTPQVHFSPDTLRIWSVLVDRLIQFIVVEHQVSENRSTTIDLSIIESALLMPFWLAGATLPNTFSGDRTVDSVVYLSYKDDLAVSKRQSDLLLAFHQECCLLTTVPTNTWINHLSVKLSSLISSCEPKVFENVNIHLISRFLRCLAQTAEISEEGSNQKDAYCTFASMKTDKQPLGQLTGLVTALNSLLLHIPWLNPPAQNEGDNSPPRRLSSQEPITRWLTSPPILSIRSRMCQLNDGKSPNESHTDSRHQNNNNSNNNNNQVSYGLLDTLEAIIFILSNHARDRDSVLWIFSTLEPSLNRLVACCVEAEQAVIEAGTDLDEPLVITQHRQQAKLALEEVFVCAWKHLKIVPPSVSVIDPLSMLQPISSEKDSKALPSTPLSALKITRSTALIDQYQAILKMSLNLCGCNVESNKNSRDSIPIHLSTTFITWFIGYWNYLVSQYCVKQTKNDASKLTNIRNFMTNWEPEVRKIVLRIFNPNMQHVGNVDSVQKNTGKRKSIPHKTPKSEPTKRRPRLLKRTGSHSPEEVSVNLNMKKEKDFSVDSVLNASSSGKKSLKSKKKVELEKPSKPETGSSESPSDANDLENTDVQVLLHSPSSKRPLRGRLSLVKDENPVQRIVTPLRRSLGITRSITQSAPSNFETRRGRSKKGVNLFPASPKPSPVSGIIAEAFGIPPGSSLMEHHEWSPSMPSPGPLKGRPLVKRRLFAGPQETSIHEANAQLLTSRKRHFSESEQNSVISPKVEDSNDFVFIPPQTESAKKRRRCLTIHQKERFKEQKSEYIPPTYTELDISQQSWSSTGDSQSQSLPPVPSLQSTENKSCLQVSETPEFMDSEEVKSTSTTTISTKNDEDIINNVEEVDVDLPCNEAGMTPIEVVLSPLTKEPVSTEESDSKDDLEIIQDTEVTDTQCEVEKTLENDISTELNKSNLSPVETVSHNVVDDSPKLNSHGNDNNENDMSAGEKKELSPSPVVANDDVSSTAPSPVVANDDLSSTAPSKSISKDDDDNDGDNVKTVSTSSVSVPAILTSRPIINNVSSPLIRGSSRAQKMLALGLQKAAEQTARQRSSSGDQNTGNSSSSRGVLSADNSPVSTERRPMSNLLASPTCVSFSPSGTGSPSGIMRNLWSKKKSQRVSFAEEPVVYTIGSNNSFHHDSDDNDADDYQRYSNLSRKKVLYNLEEDASEFNVLSDDNNTALKVNPPQSSSETNQVMNGMTEKEDVNRSSIVVTSEKSPSSNSVSHFTFADMPVDLDASQNSSQSVLSVTVKSVEQVTPPVPSSYNNNSESSSHHRRKSASPQRREFPIRKNSIGPKSQKSALPKYRLLFMEPVIIPAPVSNNVKSKAVDTEEEQDNILAVDSEPIVIADSQTDENNAKTVDGDGDANCSNVIEQTQSYTDNDDANANDDDEECILIESSQGSSQVENGEDQSVCSSISQIEQCSFSPITVESSSEVNIENMKDESTVQTVDLTHDDTEYINDSEDVTTPIISNEDKINSEDNDIQQNISTGSDINANTHDNDNNNNNKMIITTLMIIKRINVN
ncbi:unnamed protein product [Trichobilharzia szidati]|nr:unnamed protein product [Trichobilharzia szidati]